MYFKGDFEEPCATRDLTFSARISGESLELRVQAQPTMFLRRIYSAEVRQVSDVGVVFAEECRSIQDVKEYLRNEENFKIDFRQQKLIIIRKGLIMKDKLMVVKELPLRLLEERDVDEEEIIVEKMVRRCSQRGDLTGQQIKENFEIIGSFLEQLIRVKKSESHFKKDAQLQFERVKEDIHKVKDNYDAQFDSHSLQMKQIKMVVSQMEQKCEKSHKNIVQALNEKVGNQTDKLISKLAMHQEQVQLIKKQIVQLDQKAKKSKETNMLVEDMKQSMANMGLKLADLEAKLSKCLDRQGKENQKLFTMFQEYKQKTDSSMQSTMKITKQIQQCLQAQKQEQKQMKSEYIKLVSETEGNNQRLHQIIEEYKNSADLSIQNGLKSQRQILQEHKKQQKRMRTEYDQKLSQFAEQTELKLTKYQKSLQMSSEKVANVEGKLTSLGQRMGELEDEIIAKLNGTKKELESHIRSTEKIVDGFKKQVKELLNNQLAEKQKMVELVTAEVKEFVVEKINEKMQTVGKITQGKVEQPNTNKEIKQESSNKKNEIDEKKETIKVLNKPQQKSEQKQKFGDSGKTQQAKLSRSN